MNFHVKDDFKAGTPISAVGAAWFNKVAGFLNNLVGVRGLTVNKPETPSAGAPVTVELDNSPVVGSPVSVGSFPDDEVTQSASALWTAGGDNGAGLFVVYKDTTDSNAGTHKLYAAKVTISADGRIVRIDAATDKGIEIGA